MTKNDVMTLEEASRVAGCSRDTIRRAAQKDDLRAEMGPGTKGPQWWIQEADLMDWLQSRGKVVTLSAVSESPDQQHRVRELERQLADQERQAQQAQQELSKTRAELRLAQQKATQAAEQLKTARGLVENWSGQRRVASLRKLLGF